MHGSPLLMAEVLREMTFQPRNQPCRALTSSRRIPRRGTLWRNSSCLGCGATLTEKVIANVSPESGEASPRDFISSFRSNCA